MLLDFTLQDFLVFQSAFLLERNEFHIIMLLRHLALIKMRCGIPVIRGSYNPS